MMNFSASTPASVYNPFQKQAAAKTPTPKFASLHNLRQMSPAERQVMEEEYERATPPLNPGVFRDVMGRVLETVKLYLPATEHTGGLFAMDRARQQGLMADKSDVVLINVDSHSDLYNFQDLSKNPDVGIATWVNHAITHYPQVSEFIWVMPKEIAKTIQRDPVSFNARQPLKEKPLTGLGENIPLYVKKDTRETFFQNAPEEYEYEPELYDVINVRMITADQLPNLKGRDVYLSMDMDYFSNMGTDTIGNTEVPYKGSEQVREIFERLDRADVRPFLLNTAISPKYSMIPGLDPLGGPLKCLEAAVHGILNEIGKACGGKGKGNLHAISGGGQGGPVRAANDSQGGPRLVNRFAQGGPR